MKNLEQTCDCIGTANEDALCAAADDMYTKADFYSYLVFVAWPKKEADFFSEFVAKYGPANID